MNELARIDALLAIRFSHADAIEAVRRGIDHAVLAMYESNRSGMAANAGTVFDAMFQDETGQRWRASPHNARNGTADPFLDGLDAVPLRARRVRITNELLEAMLAAVLRDGATTVFNADYGDPSRTPGQWATRCTAGMPAGSRIVGVNRASRFDTNETVLMVHHESFDPVPPADVIPEIRCEFTRAEVLTVRTPTETIVHPTGAVETLGATAFPGTRWGGLSGRWTREMADAASLPQDGASYVQRQLRRELSPDGMDDAARREMFGPPESMTEEERTLIYGDPAVPPPQGVVDSDGRNITVTREDLGEMPFGGETAAPWRGEGTASFEEWATGVRTGNARQVRDAERGANAGAVLKQVPRHRLADLAARSLSGNLTNIEALAVVVLRGGADGENAAQPMLDMAIEEFGHGSYRVPVRVVSDFGRCKVVVRVPEDETERESDAVGREVTAFLRHRGEHPAVLMLPAGWGVEVYEEAASHYSGTQTPPPDQADGPADGIRSDAPDQ